MNSRAIKKPMAPHQDNVTNFQIPLWLMVLCSAVMALGTSIGGYRIIKAVGMDCLLYTSRCV